MHHRRLLSLLAITTTGALLAPATHAQDSWPFISFEVLRYDNLLNTNEDNGIACCAPHLVQAPDHVLIHISAEVEVPWSEELDRVSTFASKLTLTVPGGEPVGPIGEYERLGLFTTSAGGVSASRPRDWPETDEIEHLDMEHVWLLPADATTATLTVDEYFTAEVEIPQTTSTPITPADTANFRVTGINRVDALETENSINRQKVPGSITPAAGQILRVDFDVTPQMDTNVGGDPNFLIYTKHMQLVGPNGLPAVPLGQFLGDGIITDTSNSYSGDSFIGSSFDETFYYLTDGAPGTYTLYFLTDPVSEGALEGEGADDAANGGADDSDSDAGGLFGNSRD